MGGLLEACTEDRSRGGSGEGKVTVTVTQPSYRIVWR